ncbi:MAG TPA: HAD family hydrolase [Alloprevotella sp.]|nr:HAD family hydrolase [Alloprevotella sp.]
MNTSPSMSSGMVFDRTGISAVIFDYGGTLDTNARHWAHVLWEGYLRSGYFGRLTQEQFRLAYVFGERALAKAPIVCPQDNFRVVLEKKIERETFFLCEEGILDMNETRRMEAVRSVADYCYAYACRVTARSRQVLLSLQEKYKLVLVSNFYGNIETVLQDFSLDFFGRIIESAVVGVRKPDPAIFRLGVEAAGCEPEACVVVGDSYEKDIVPARKAGCRTVWLKGEEWQPMEVDRSLSDAVITDLPQLLNLL